jgi:hypothetical protein
MQHQGSAQPQMEAEDKASKGDRETRTSDYLLQCALEVCFMQMDEALFHKAVQKVADLCFTNLLYQQQAQLGVLLTAITAVDPQYVVNKMVPLCLRILLEHDAPRTYRTPTSGRGLAKTPHSGSRATSWTAAAAALVADAAPTSPVKSPASASKEPYSPGSAAGSDMRSPTAHKVWSYLSAVHAVVD